ncbi:TetR/AcrR family transcriptional regulator [Nocardia terpenica]|uniref:TetR/AcrR family transcriptional regulator n=1 Tax=Nocardia terpenica TaxID=455432 RepID=UPI00142D7D58|nr:TetR/AcrR family transcriptional regulator [Nocardia terpenica]
MGVEDRDRRQARIAEATWRLIRRGGLAAASVRNIAAEAGMSMGSVRHLFTTQQQLLSFAMEQVRQRAWARVEPALQSPLDSPRRVESVLAETLPLDEQRRTESEVWVSLLAAGLIDLQLREHAERAHADLLSLERHLLDGLVRAGHLRGNLDLDLEAARLHALLHGLAVDLVTSSHLATEQVTRILRHHLDSLRSE